MKLCPKLGSTLGLLAVVAISAPLSSLAADGSKAAAWSYGEGTLYNDLRTAQSGKSMDMHSGAQGPIRSETMEPTLSYAEGGLYENLKAIQESFSAMGFTPRGAQGPVRGERMEPSWSYAEGGLYENLKLIQSEH